MLAALVLVVASASPADDAHALTSLLAAGAASVPGVQASTAADLHDIVAVEGEKQALTCDPGSLSSCTAELAQAFGARYLLASELGTLGDDRTLALNVIDTQSAASAARVVVRARTLDDLVKKAEGAMPGLLADRRVDGTLRLLVLETKVTSSSPPAAAPPGAGVPALAWVGGVVAVGGLVLLGAGVAGDVYVGGLERDLTATGSARLDQPTAAAKYEERDADAGYVQAFYIGGAVVTVVGAALIGAAVVGGP